jgi:alkylation response protein AidB-like acyl-CoA dehydrogenase
MSATDMESVESFRERAREWLAANVEKGEPLGMGYRRGETEEEELALIASARELQRKYYEAGFAGICFPKEYGGQGLSPEHQRAFNQEVVGYVFPSILQVPTFVPCAAVLPQDHERRRDLDAVPLRAQWRFRRGRRAHHRDARR